MPSCDIQWMRISFYPRCSAHQCSHPKLFRTTSRQRASLTRRRSPLPLLSPRTGTVMQSHSFQHAFEHSGTTGGVSWSLFFMAKQRRIRIIIRQQFGGDGESFSPSKPLDTSGKRDQWQEEATLRRFLPNSTVECSCVCALDQREEEMILVRKVKRGMLELTERS